MNLRIEKTNANFFNSRTTGKFLKKAFAKLADRLSDYTLISI